MKSLKRRLPALLVITLLSLGLWSAIFSLDVSSQILVVDSFPAHQFPSLLPQCVEAPIAAWRSHRYFIDLAAGEYLQLRVEQLGADVSIVVRGASQLLHFDSPNGRTGVEVVDLEARVSDTYEIEIQSQETGWYRSEITALRLAAAKDQARAAAKISKLKATNNIITVSRKRLDPADRAKLFLRATRLWQETGDPQEERWTLFDFLDRDGPAARTLKSQNRASLSARAIDLYTDAGNRWRVARLMHREGTHLYRDGDYRQALSSYEDSLHAWEALGKATEQAAVLNEKGLLYLRLDSIDLALESFQAARALYRQLSKRCNEGVVWINIGRVEANLGETSPALASFRTARDLLNGCPRRERPQSLALTKIGDMQIRLGNLTASLENYQESLALSRTVGDVEGTASTLNSLGLAWLKSKRPKETFAALTESRRLFEAKGRYEKAAVVLGNICWAHELMGDLERSLDCFFEALRGAEGHSYQNLEAAIHTGIARVQIRQATESLGRSDTPQELLTKAWTHLELAAELVETIRDRSQRRDLRAAFLSRRQEVFYLATQVTKTLNQTRYDETALEAGLIFFDRSLARNLLDSLTRLRTGEPPVIAATEVLRKVNDRHLRAMADSVDGGVDHDWSLHQLVMDLRQARAYQLGLHKPRHLIPDSIAQIQQALGDALLLLFQEPDTASRELQGADHFVWVVSADRIDLKALPDFPSSQELEDLHRLLALPPRKRPEDLNETLASISRQILKPLTGELATFRRVLVIPTGALHFIPLSALLHENSQGQLVPLVVSHSFGRLPSASSLPILRAAQARRPRPTRTALLIGDPVFGPTDLRLHDALEGTIPDPPTGPPLESKLRSRLVHTAAEIESIQNALRDDGTQILKGFAVQKSALSNMEAYELLHFATHGLTRTSMPELTSLMLSQYNQVGAPVSDGFLRAHEIEGLALSARLVVLSACSSAMGRQLYGEGLIGLPHAFLSSGVPRIVVSLWDIDDRSTAHLMNRFYHRMTETHLSPQDALHLAQTDLLEDPEWKDPFYWAAFVHYGDPL